MDIRIKKTKGKRHFRPHKIVIRIDNKQDLEEIKDIAKYVRDRVYERSEYNMIINTDGFIKQLKEFCE